MTRLNRWGWALAAVGLVGIVGIGVFLFLGRSSAPRPIRIGSKAFTEGVILGDVLTLLLRSEGLSVEHKSGFGGTRFVFDALRTGEIDAYVDYTGTLQREILAKEGHGTLGEIREGLEAKGVRMGPPLGFENSYDLGMRRDRAAALGIRTLSDLKDHPDLVMSFSNEFLEREDGWRALQRRYGLPQTKVSGLEHSIAYQGVASGQTDVIDVYSTDAKIQELDLVVLEDDLHFFPSYAAVILYRATLETTNPEVVEAFESLRDEIDETRMIALNAGVALERRDEVALAATFLEEDLGRYVQVETETWTRRLLKRTMEHLALVGSSLLVAILLGIALGIVAARTGAFGQAVIGVVGAAQTFPGLALLALLVPVMGIGWKPTVFALVVYSLLPIVRNTHAGLTGIPKPLRESALVLGLPGWTRLGSVEMPLAAPSILAGIKTAAVWNVGLATIGALIGAGGYGDSILAGIRRNDTPLILQGAIPAILLALLVQGFFDVLERWIVSPGLRYGRERRA